MDRHYVSIEMKWLSLFILLQVDYAGVDVITAGLLWQSGGPSPVVHVCGSLRVHPWGCLLDPKLNNK